MSSCVLYFTIFLAVQIVFVQPLQWYCNSNTECTASDSFCSDVGLCQCKDGNIFSSDLKKCLPITTSPEFNCEDDNQCTELIGGHSECNKGNCACVDGYRYLNDACVIAKRLGTGCAVDLDCFDGVDYNSMVCKDKICKCNSGYYDRANFDCRPSAKALGTCFFDTDCEAENLVCDFGYGPTGNCVEKKKSFAQKQMVFEELELFEPLGIDLSCKVDKDCATIPNSFCPKFLKKCTCQRGFIFEKSLNKCIAALGSSCTDKCELKNSICLNNICQCKTYFINGYLNERCFKPARSIGQSCTHNKNCQSLGNNAVCSDKLCSCNEKSSFDVEFQMCRPKNSESIGCTINSDCSYKAHSECQYFQCICSDHYTDSNDKCLSNIGASCNVKENDCVIPNAKCIDDRCICKDNFISDNSISCLPVVLNLTQSCKTDEQCIELLGIGAKCNSNKCGCQPEYVMKNNTCLVKKYFGDFCISRQECSVMLKSDHVRCQNNYCVCDYGFTQNEQSGCVADNSSSCSTYSIYLFVTLMFIIIFNM